MIVANASALSAYLASRPTLLNRLNVLNVLNYLNSLVPNNIATELILLLVIPPIWYVMFSIVGLLGYLVYKSLRLLYRFFKLLGQAIIESCQDMYLSAKDYFKEKLSREEDMENPIGSPLKKEPLSFKTLF